MSIIREIILTIIVTNKNSSEYVIILSPLCRGASHHQVRFVLFYHILPNLSNFIFMLDKTQNSVYTYIIKAHRERLPHLND